MKQHPRKQGMAYLLVQETPQFDKIISLSNDLSPHSVL